nr:hypothetical protein BdHM001_31740 [Bdellovibrio sp. HM001]
MQATTEFSKKVLSFIMKIPRGKIATYGQIAALAGKPQGARGVAWLLHSCSESHDLPWQRVLNSKGKISFAPGSAEFKKQKKLLESEGVEFSGVNQIDMKRFQWRKKPKTAPKDPNRPVMFSGRE